jgi:hypothetical protein
VTGTPDQSKSDVSIKNLIFPNSEDTRKVGEHGQWLGSVSESSCTRSRKGTCRGGRWRRGRHRIVETEKKVMLKHRKYNYLIPLYALFAGSSWAYKGLFFCLYKFIFQS